MLCGSAYTAFLCVKEPEMIGTLFRSSLKFNKNFDWPSLLKRVSGLISLLIQGVLTLH